MFSLHPQLEADTIKLGKLTICQVLLMNDSRFPWLILVPEIANIKELHQLDPDTQALVLEEIVSVGELAMRFFNGDKLNTAALGNLVPQLHIHQIVRFSDDCAWPNPVWGFEKSIAYSSKQLKTLLDKLTVELTTNVADFTAC